MALTMRDADNARFTLISSNRLDRLAALLSERLAQPADGNLLVPDTILIPQPTLRRWLQQTLAQRHGVAANLQFLTPSEWVWQLLRADMPGLPGSSPWERGRLRWRLFALLGAADLPRAVDEHLQRVAGDAALARFRLADALAGAFDKYQAYRREWLLAWERGDEPHDWQAQLWRRLQGDAASIRAPHRAALIGDWLQRHDATGLAPPGLPSRLAAFGTIHVSPDVLRMLGVAGQSIALDFYLPTPSSEYWGDVESLRARLQRDGIDALPVALAEWQHENPLLANWGVAGREFAAQLFSYEAVSPAEEIDAFVAPASDSLLHRLQADVLQRRAPQPGAIAADDLSLQVHASHSKLREVEVLHDRLRALLDADDSLSPRDIAVLASDIGDYIPLVRAVFGGVAPADPRHIPYSLADRPQAQAHPLVGLFLELLQLPESRFPSSSLLDLLGVPAVLRALDLDAIALERIAGWFDAAGIRWGEDEDARERAGVGRWREHSVAFGLDRLLLGYATGDSDVIDGIAPSAQLEGADAQTLDCVLSVVERLQQLAQWMRGSHSAQEWQRRLAQEFNALLGAASADDAEAQARRMVLEALDVVAREAGEAGALPCIVLRAALQERLATPSPHQPFLAGGVTFAGMVPLRTVPFRVICLLGLDADAYPRREPGGEVNRLVDALQGRAPRKLGDRSVRDDDRFLFLQLLCAAGDVFYLSYGGRDARDGSVREPSALVSELLDVADRYFAAVDGARQQCVIEHPLQPFSPQAFGQGDARRFSYRQEWWSPRSDAQTLEAEAPFVSAARPAKTTTVPDRDALQRFFANPARAFLRDIVGVRLPDCGTPERDREPLGVDGLVRYQAIEHLLQRPSIHRQAQGTTSAELALLRANGLLPPGGEGVALAAQASDVASRLAEARDVARGAFPAGVVETGEGVAFRFDDVHDGARVITSPGRVDGKRRLRAGLDHLLLASQLGLHARTVLIGFDAKANDGDGAVVEAVYAGIDAQPARDALQHLLDLWRDGQTRPLPFAPKASFAYVEALSKNKPSRDAWNAARTAFAPFNLRVEDDDPWLQLAFRPDGLFANFDAAHAQQFRDIATRVFNALDAAP